MIGGATAVTPVAAVALIAERREVRRRIEVMNAALWEDAEAFAGFH